MFRKLCAYVPMCLCAFSRASVPSSKPAFSLIEVLVSMTVLIVIIVMVTNMFRNASEAWDMGTQRAEMNTSARAAIEYIARELSCAVAGSMPDSTGGVAVVNHFTLRRGAGMDYNVTNLSFTALSGENQALRGVLFRFDSANRIIETEHNNNPPYSSSAWTWPTAALLITNVWRFEVTVCSNESDMLNGGVGYAYDSSLNSDLLPACVDILIEMLGERDMTRALGLGAAQDGFVMTNSRVYTTRVCFPNRGSR
jgi:type II secretory pathway pseudopilin PulG